MTNQDSASRIANQVFAFVQDISQDRQVLEKLVGLAGDRGHEINVSALGRFLAVSSGLTPAELTDAELEAVSGGLDAGSMFFNTIGTILDASEADASSMGGLLATYASTVQAAKDATIGAKQSKMASGSTMQEAERSLGGS